MTLVTLLTIPANAISHARRGKGQVLSYEMILGIKVGRDSVTFRHDDYEVQVNRSAKQRRRELQMPTLMAARLIPFARACFVPKGVTYDGADFTMYVSGYQASPQHRSHGSVQLVCSQVDDVAEMQYHVIGSDTGEVIHPFIGLKDQYALSVLGLRDTFGISRVTDLMRVYGGAMLGRVDRVHR